MNDSKTKNFLLRALSAGIMLPAFFFMTMYNAWTYFTLFLLINIFALHEYCSIFKIQNYNKYSVLLLSALLFASPFLYKIGLTCHRVFLFPYVFGLLWMYGVVVRSKININSEYLNEIALCGLGILYITLPMILMNFVVIKNGQYNYKILLGTFLCIWATDTGAYIIGSLFGKTKCFKNISPNKSLEGVLGGLFASVITAFFIKDYFFDEKFSSNWYVIGFFIAIGSVIGDLFESLLKRYAGVKNSGTLIPGHGGVLDRIDSFLLVIGVVWILQLVL